MRFSQKSLVAAAIGLAAINYTGIASADVTWTFDTANCIATVPGGNCGSNDFADQRTYQGVGTGAVNVTVTGWANTTSSNTALELGEITHYGGGLGVKNADAGGGDSGEGTSPEHAVDNDQRYDLVLFDFGVGNSFALTDIQIGWASGDADINLLAYEGGGVGDTPNLDGVVFNATNEDLTDNGWVHVADYDLSPTDGAVNADPDGAGPQERATSRYWIISAHNSVFGDNCINDSNGCPTLNDHFKIASVSGKLTPPPPPPNTGVPVPAPLALLGLGLVAVAYGSKRKQQA